MRPTTVSLFCGAGGESLGKQSALRKLGVLDCNLNSHAINHWPLAINAHQINLPTVQAHPADITKVDASSYGISECALLWGSPSCTQFSKAKGGIPKDDQQREHAWEINNRWLRKADVQVLLVENVSEFQDWGPLHKDHSGGCRAESLGRFIGLTWAKGRPIRSKCRKGCHFMKPIRERRGEFFKSWTKDLRDLGYEADWRVLCAADYGVPTTRKRFFLQAVKDGKGIHWPEPTHRDPRKSVGLFDAALPPWRTAAECIDWSIPCPSIFDRKKPLAPATLRRIAAGVVRYVLEAKRPFLVNLTHGGRLEDLNEPFKTITGANRGEKALVVPSLVGVGGRAGQSRPRGVDEPFATCTAKADGAVVAAFLAKHFTGVVGASLEQPMPTVTGTDHNSLVAASLVQMCYGEREGQAPRALDIEQPLGTVVAGGIKHGLVAAHMMSIDQQSTGASACRGADEPMSTATTKARHALVAAFIQHYYGQGGQTQDPSQPLHTITTLARHGLVTVEIDGESYVITDIGMRMLEPRELARAMGFPPTYQWIQEDGTPLTKRDAVKMIGNAVPPALAEALVMAVAGPRPELFGGMWEGIA